MPPARVAKSTSAEDTTAGSNRRSTRSASKPKVDTDKNGNKNVDPTVPAVDEEDNDPSFGSARKTRGKRKATASASTAGNARKRAKTAPKPKKVKKCTTCNIPLDSPNAVFYAGHPEGSVEEFIALTNPKLSIEVNEKAKTAAVDEDDDDTMTGAGGLLEERPGYRITGFTFYDREGHLVPLEGSLLESLSAEILFSGYIKVNCLEVLKGQSLYIKIEGYISGR